MRFLTPLGLLGLLGILVLIIIYILRPNYQQKFVSSTYIWKLSLKYRKKRIPTSKLRDLLLILCQVLILAGSAAALATPVQVLREQPTDNEVIAIIDASASMRAQYNGEMRFERACNRVLSLADTVFGNDGTMSVIVANDDPVYLIREADRSASAQLNEDINDLLISDMCTYGSANVEEAFSLCEDVVAANPATKIYFYTDTTYTYVPNNVEVVNVSDSNEINASILDASATFESGYYRVTAHIALFGANGTVRLKMNVNGANAVDINDPGDSREFSIDVECYDDQVQTVVFCVERNDDDLSEEEKENTTYYIFNDAERFYSYQSILLSFDYLGDFEDCFMDDDTFSIYGGQKEVINIKYSSSLKNPFVTSALLSLQNYYSNNWEIHISDSLDTPNEGFDIYIFEHEMPQTLPRDGVVFLFDPLSSPSGSGLTLRNIVDLGGTEGAMPLEEVTNDDSPRSPVLNNINLTDILVTRYTRLDDDGTYETLASCDGDPVLLVRNDDEAKIAVMAFSLHYTNLPLKAAFPRLMSNLFSYFMPSTIDSNYYEVGSTIEFNSRGSSLKVTSESGSGVNEDIMSFPSSLSIDLPGTYRIEQMGVFDKDAPDIQFYVKIPAAESNTRAVLDALPDPFVSENQYDYFNDLLIYLAAAIVAFLFLEWILQLRDNM